MSLFPIPRPDGNTVERIVVQMPENGGGLDTFWTTLVAAAISAVVASWVANRTHRLNERRGRQEWMREKIFEATTDLRQANRDFRSVYKPVMDKVLAAKTWGEAERILNNADWTPSKEPIDNMRLAALRLEMLAEVRTHSWTYNTLADGAKGLIGSMSHAIEQRKSDDPKRWGPGPATDDHLQGYFRKMFDRQYDLVESICEYHKFNYFVDTKRVRKADKMQERYAREQYRELIKTREDQIKLIQDRIKEDSDKQN